LSFQSVLLVCMGNICRSPTAEAVLRAKAHTVGIMLKVDSAGTIANHIGAPADPRAITAGNKRGYHFKGIKARQVSIKDFEKFDLLLAADEENLRDLLAICPQMHKAKVKLLLSYGNSDYQEIPDPYYGGAKGFELVLDLIEQACDSLLVEHSG